MTDVARLSTLRHAMHTDAYTFTGTPGTLYPLRPTDDGASFLPRNRTPLARNLRSLSGRRYSHIRGVQDLADLTVMTEFRGVNSNTGAAVTDWEAKMEQGYMLASMFGAVAPATTGTAPTVAAAGHSPSTGVIEVVGTNTVNGQVIAFRTSSTGPQGSALVEVGQIASGGGTTTLTLEHPYSGTPETAATVYRLGVYTVDDDLTHHTHMFFSAEGEDWRRDYFGCAPLSMSLDLATAGIVGMSTVWSPTSFSDVAEGNPAHAEPTSGSPTVVDACKVWFAGEEFIARDLTLTYSNGMASRVASTRNNGNLGSVASVQPKEFKIEFSLYIGNGNLSGELYEDQGFGVDVGELVGDDENAGDVSTTRELSVQIGTEVGALVYAFMGAADCVVTTQIVDGLTMARVVATGTGATPGILAVG